MAKKAQTARGSKRKKPSVQRKKYSPIPKITWRQLAQLTTVCSNFRHDYKSRFEITSGILLTEESIVYLIRYSNIRFFSVLTNLLTGHRILPPDRLIRPVVFELWSKFGRPPNTSFMKGYRGSYEYIGGHCVSRERVRTILILLDALDGRIEIPLEMKRDMISSVMEIFRNCIASYDKPSLRSAIQKLACYLVKEWQKKEKK